MHDSRTSRSSSPVVVLSDVHLSINVQPERETAVCEVLARHPGLDVVFLGDLFEFSSAGTDDATVALARLMSANARFRAAVRSHATSGAHVWFVAGNHDAELANLEVQLGQHCGPNVTVVQWCLRLGNVHLEHGHLYDRDNAPLHPLAPHTREHESLGAALMRRVVVDMDLRVFAHAHSLTPLRGLITGFKALSWRLPRLLFGLAVVIGDLLVRATWGRWGAGAALRRIGAQRVGAAARSSGLSSVALEALIASVPSSTHSNMRRVLFRLYVDWVIAALGAAVCVLGVVAGYPTAAWGAVASLGYVLASWRNGGFWRLCFNAQRYYPPLQALLAGASNVVKLTNASRVVLGHTHVEHDDGVYFNLGSFGYGGSAGRPYAVVAPCGHVTRHFVAFDCGQ